MLLNVSARAAGEAAAAAAAPTLPTFLWIKRKKKKTSPHKLQKLLIEVQLLLYPINPLVILLCLKLFIWRKNIQKEEMCCSDSFGNLFSTAEFCLWQALVFLESALLTLLYVKFA